MGKAKPIEKESKPEEVGIGQMALAQIILQAGLRQDVCLLAKLANGCKTFEEFKAALNGMAEEFKKELEETKVQQVNKEDIKKESDKMLQCPPAK